MEKFSGSQPRTDIRGDEEQEVKCQEVMELFLAAGYFRARIKVSLILSGPITHILDYNYRVKILLIFHLKRIMCLYILGPFQF